ncbi:MAG TPA: hypothetical protein VIF14_11920 [Alphaproteobacteria bacterium]
MAIVASQTPVGAAAETLPPPRPGLVVEWRQSIEGMDSTAVRHEIVSANGPIVVHRESASNTAAAPTHFETWRGLVLIKRHIPQSDAFTESTVAFTLDLPALEALVPLSPGGRGRFDITGRAASRLGLTASAPFRTSDLSAALTIAIERREAVSVPAGRFESIVIRHDVAIEEVGLDNVVTVRARIWFAAELGWPVKKQQLDAEGAVEAEAVAIRVIQPR